MEGKYGFLKTFDDFIYWLNDVDCIEDEELMCWHHFRKQTDFICSREEDIIVDLLFPIEDMTEAVDFLRSRFHLNGNISHTNQSSKQEYSNLPMKVVEDYYRRDTKVWQKVMEKKLYWATDWSE